MRLEQTTDNSIHIMEGSQFLGSFVGPKLTSDKGWQYKPTDCLLAEGQLYNIRRHLQKLNA